MIISDVRISDFPRYLGNKITGYSGSKTGTRENHYCRCDFYVTNEGTVILIVSCRCDYRGTTEGLSLVNAYVGVYFSRADMYV